MKQEARREPSSARPAANPAALGTDGDFPMPYAILRVVLDESGKRAVDVRYTHASNEYCQAISRTPEGIIGRSFFENSYGGEDEWLERCYRAAVLGESVRDFEYNPLARSWTNTKIVPSATEGCCIYILDRILIDEHQRKQLITTTDARTSYFILEMLNDLAAEQGYETAMNDMLARMSTVVHADRLCIFECRGDTTKVIFERCKAGIEPQLGAEYGLRQDMMAHWFRYVTEDHVVLVPNISVLQRFSEPLYRWCRAIGVESLLAAPFFSDGKIVGFLGAYNYQIDETVDLNRFFEAVSTFIASRIDNHRLIKNLEQASMHDALTGLLNRRGSEEEIRARLADDPDGRYVLALVDLDDFKRVNDVYGHNAGDEALCALASKLRKSFSHDAVISRNGGDEFLVFLQGDAGANASATLAQLTLQGVEFQYEGASRHVSLSIGYARYPEQAQTLRRLLSKADAALYAVKLTGKAGFGKYTPEAEARQRFQLGFSARDILDNAPHPLLVCAAGAMHEVLFASGKLANLLGYGSVGELLRVAKGVFGGIVHPKDRTRTTAVLGKLDTDAPGTHTSFAFHALAADGNAHLLNAQSAIVEIRDSGRAIYILFEE